MGGCKNFQMWFETFYDGNFVYEMARFALFEQSTIICMNIPKMTNNYVSNEAIGIPGLLIMYLLQKEREEHWFDLCSANFNNNKIMTIFFSLKTNGG